MAKKSIGILQAALRLEASQFRKELGTTSSTWAKFARSFALPAAIVAGAGAGLKKALDAVTASLRFMLDEFAKVEVVGRLADRFGMAIEDLHALQLAADDSGVSSEAFGTSFQRMSRKIGDAMRGIPEAVRLFESLGLDPEFLSTREPVEQLQLMADAIRRVGTEQEQLSATVKVFDSEGAVLLSWFRDVNFEIIAQQKLYKDLGLVMDKQVYERAKQVNAELALMHKAWAALKVDLAQAIAGSEDLTGAGAAVAVMFRSIAESISLVMDQLRQLARMSVIAEPLARLFDSLRGSGRQVMRGSQIGARLDRELLRLQAGGAPNPDFLRRLREEQAAQARRDEELSRERNSTLELLVRTVGRLATPGIVRF